MNKSGHFIFEKKVLYCFKMYLVINGSVLLEYSCQNKFLILILSIVCILDTVNRLYKTRDVA